MTESSVLECPSPTLVGSLHSSLKLSDLTPDQLRQRDLEIKYRDEALGKREREDVKLWQSSRGSQTMVAKGFLQTLVPGVAFWVEHHIRSAKLRSNNCGQAIKELLRLNTWTSTETMGHIGVSVVLDNLGRGASYKTSISTIQIEIGRQIEDQSFIEYIAAADPLYYSKLKKWYLNDPIRTYDKKVYALKHSLNSSEELSWDWMDPTEHARVGALILKAIMSVPVEGSDEGLFEKKQVRSSKTKTTDYLGFSLTGIYYRDVIQDMMDQLVYKPKPMVCPPLPWSLTERGGYLLQPPSRWGELVHGNHGTVPSQTALDALNRLQAQPYRINEYILDVQLELLKKTWDLGSFKSYESTSWKDEHFPLVDSNYLDTLDKDGEEYLKVMKSLKEAYHNQKIDEKQALTPRRVVMLADEFRSTVFYTPWFFDSRTRCYPQSELSITQGDFVKALLVNANPKPLTENTRKELLIAIATSGDFGKVSKKSYEERIKWSEEFVASEEFIEMVKNPLDVRKWMDADEIFQFLSYCEEFYSLFVTGERDTTRVWVGRDMSCSGIQILSSVIGDESAMEFTNVIPSDSPKDAYGEVARCARVLLQDKSWLAEKYDKFRIENEKWNANHSDQKPREIRMFHEIDLGILDRGIAKKPVMLTGYGGSLLRKREHIYEELKERGLKLHIQDKKLIVAALVEGMTLAFPKYEELNAWFKQVVKAAVSAGVGEMKWVTPNGTLVVQDYREPLYTKIQTHCASGGHYSKLLKDDTGCTTVLTGYGGIKESKHSSACAANLTHSVDACIIQNGIDRLEDGVDCVTVHDCLYFQPGYNEKVSPVFRQAFYGVVTTPILQSYLDENGLEVSGIENPQTLHPDLLDCVHSEYMFS